MAEPEFSVEGLGPTRHYPPPTEVAEDAERKKLHLQERAQEIKIGEDMHYTGPKALRTPGIQKWTRQYIMEPQYRSHRQGLQCKPFILNNM